MLTYPGPSQVASFLKKIVVEATCDQHIATCEVGDHEPVSRFLEGVLRKVLVGCLVELNIHQEWAVTGGTAILFPVLV